jgi:amino acid transporter
MREKLSLFSLVLLIVAAIDSIRNLPATALFGSHLIFFFLLGAILFLIPVSMVAAELASRYPEEGGVFPWVRHAFGGQFGFLAVWLQWINTIVWYPTMLSFIAGTAAYLVRPDWAENQLFLVALILAVFWGLTFLGSRGLRISSKVNSICTILGTLVPMVILIGLGATWVMQGHPIAISFDARAMVPSISSSESWVSLIAIIASYVGMELAGVHVTDIQNPQKNFPRALAISIGLLLGTMILGSLSIAVGLSRDEIRLVDGIMQIFSHFLATLGFDGWLPLFGGLIVVGSIGNMINWVISPAKGLLQAAQEGFFPGWLMKRNHLDVPVRILWMQALFVSLLCLVFMLMPTINAFYWFLTALSTGLYLLMYMLLFLAALKLGRPKAVRGVYKIPSGFRTLTCSVGLFGCLLTFFISLFPPDTIDVGGHWRYACLIVLGNGLLLTPVAIFSLYQKWKIGRAV